MTNEEVICQFMEPKLSNHLANGTVPSPKGWWMGLSRFDPAVSPKIQKWWAPIFGNCDKRVWLGLLWEVEERLRIEYKKDALDLWWLYWERMEHIGFAWHASAEQKIKALASVLGPIVKEAV
jgi:hypothetical protein